MAVSAAILEIFKDIDINLNNLIVDIFIHHKMIEAKKIQLKKQRNVGLQQNIR